MKRRTNAFQLAVLLMVLFFSSAMLQAQIKLPTLQRNFPVNRTTSDAMKVKEVSVRGGQIIITTSDNQEFVLPDGVYKTPEGNEITVKDGRIVSVSIKERPKPSEQQSEPVVSGRYRVTINGFEVRHETWDHAFEVDGKRDEVYIAVDVTLADKQKGLSLANYTSTEIYGDINGYPMRIKAGSASNKGGIRTGDKIPGRRPWERRGTPQPDRLPMHVWEGELVKGQNVVMLIPTIWEYDGGKDVFDEWVSWAKKTANTLKNSETLAKLIGKEGVAVIDLTELGLGIALSLQRDGILGQAQDRPIGVKPKGNSYVFAPKAVVLNYETAEFALRKNVGGKGPGIIAIPYRDDPKLAGDYILYLQIERI